MTKREQIASILEGMGYKPQVDEDGDLTMHYQMKEICAIVGDEDDKYVSLLLPRFAEVEEGEETLNLAVCNKMTRDLKLAKVYIDQTFKYVTASCEFFYSDEDSLKEHIGMSMNVLGILRSLFRNTKSELEKEA